VRLSAILYGTDVPIGSFSGAHTHMKECFIRALGVPHSLVYTVDHFRHAIRFTLSTERLDVATHGHRETGWLSFYFRERIVIVTILVVILILMLLGGGYGFRSGNNALAGGGGLIGLILIILLILVLTGHVSI